MGFLHCRYCCERRSARHPPIRLVRRAAAAMTMAPAMISWMKVVATAARPRPGRVMPAAGRRGQAAGITGPAVSVPPLSLSIITDVNSNMSDDAAGGPAG